MSTNRIEFHDKIKTSNGTIWRYRNYFSGKMEMIESRLPLSGIKTESKPEQRQEPRPHETIVSGLPSDEEIEAWVKGHGYYGHCTAEYHEGLEEGAKWVRNNIKKDH